MVLIVAYHYSPRRNRRSIQRRGLIAHAPKMGNLHGVYVWTTGFRHAPSGVAWGNWVPDMMGRMYEVTVDLWQVAYCGPVRRDSFVINGLVLPSITDVTLVTGNTVHGR